MMVEGITNVKQFHNSNMSQYKSVTCSGTHVTGAHLWQNSCHRWQKRCHLWHLFCHMCVPVTCVNVTIIHCDILDLLVILEQTTFRGKFDSTRTTDLCSECERTLSSYKKQQVVHRHCTLTVYTMLHCVEECCCTVQCALRSVQCAVRAASANTAASTLDPGTQSQSYWGKPHVETAANIHHNWYIALLLAPQRISLHCCYHKSSFSELL